MSIELVLIIFLFLIIIFLQYYFYIKKIKKLQKTATNEEKKELLERTFVEVKEDKTLKAEVLKLRGIIEDTKAIAQKANLIKSDFLTNIRHEIRTPMNSILVFSEIIEKESSNKEISSYANNIFNSGHNLLHLINNIIEMSEIDSGEFKIVTSAVDFKIFIDSIIELHKFEANKKSLIFSVEIDINMPESIMIDERRVKEILDNLLNNALKFTEKGKIELIISQDYFNASKHESDISFKIKDTGIGISEVNQENIFKIFESNQVDNKTEYQGTGLSLSINKKLALLMKGNLEVNSILDVGSTFILTLRRVEVILVSKTHDVKESNIDFSMIKSNSTIVVIDNAQKTLELVIDSFLKTKLEIFTYSSLKDAIAILKSKKINLILINVNILSMDDNAVAKVLKRTTNAPIIGLVDDRLNNITFHEDGVKPIINLKKPLKKIDLFRVSLKVLNSQDISVSNGIIQELESDKGLCFTSSVEESKSYFKDHSREINSLLQEALMTNDLNTISQFAHSIHDLSSSYKLSSLVIFSKELLSKIDSFDIQGIDTMLKEYDQKSKEFNLIL